MLRYLLILEFESLRRKRFGREFLIVVMENVQWTFTGIGLLLGHNIIGGRFKIKILSFKFIFLLAFKNNLIFLNSSAECCKQKFNFD